MASAKEEGGDEHGSSLPCRPRPDIGRSGKGSIDARAGRGNTAADACRHKDDNALFDGERIWSANVLSCRADCEFSNLHDSKYQSIRAEGQ